MKNQLILKIVKLLSKIATINPWPYYRPKGYPISKVSVLMWKRCGKISFQRRWVSFVWLNFWLNIADFILKFKDK